MGRLEEVASGFFDELAERGFLGGKNLSSVATPWHLSSRPETVRSYSESDERMAGHSPRSLYIPSDYQTAPQGSYRRTIMSNDPSPLKYMGTQSRETLNMAAAMAHDSGRSTARPIDQAMGQLSDEVDDAGGDVSGAGSKIGVAANWAMGKAKDTLRSAAEQVRERAATAVATYTKEDPVRAILIAAGAGALLMGLIAMMARSGVRTVKRNVQR